MPKFDESQTPSLDIKSLPLELRGLVYSLQNVLLTFQALYRYLEEHNSLYASVALSTIVGIHFKCARILTHTMTAEEKNGLLEYLDLLDLEVKILREVLKDGIDHSKEQFFFHDFNDDGNNDNLKAKL